MWTLGKALVALCLSSALWLIAPAAKAQECTGGNCGAPNQSGGGCGCGCGCSVLIAMTDRGETYQYADDADGDGLEDEYDNCPFGSNYDQLDADGDGVGDSCDVCASVSDAAQADVDLDGSGDLCDTDADNDGWANLDDNCDLLANAAQTNSDPDALGDACDTDDDNDGLGDFEDNCRLQPGAPAEGCDEDEDDDGLDGAFDNCPGISNAGQDNVDGDLMGDACDIDMDGDEVPNYLDNCDTIPNPGQIDLDMDGEGDGGFWGDPERSCDQLECYTVPGQECLNPAGAFRVELMAPGQLQLKAGQEIFVALLTNRLNTTHTWVARLEKVPEGSDVQLENAKGAGSTLDRSPQVASCLRVENGECIELNNIRFEPDQPGEYVLQVTATLPAGDPRNQGTSTAKATFIAKVAGKAKGGCAAAAGVPSIVAAMALGLIGLVRRRRQ